MAGVNRKPVIMCLLWSHTCSTHTEMCLVRVCIFKHANKPMDAHVCLTACFWLMWTKVVLDNEQETQDKLWLPHVTSLICIEENLWMWNSKRNPQRTNGKEQWWRSQWVVNRRWMFVAQAAFTMAVFMCLKIDQKVAGGWSLGEMDV